LERDVARAADDPCTDLDQLIAKTRTARPIKEVRNVHTEVLGTPANQIRVTIQEADGEPFGIGEFSIAEYFRHEAMQKVPCGAGRPRTGLARSCSSVRRG